MNRVMLPHFTVMTHPSRLGYAQKLRAAHPELSISIAVDPDPTGVPTATRAAAVAWSADVGSATHHVVLQDDALLCQDFLAKVLKTITDHPESSVSLFAHGGSRTASAMRLAALAGNAYTSTVGDYVPTVGIVMPAAVGSKLGESLSAIKDFDTPEDFLVRDFLEDQNIPSIVVVPNLVQHHALTSLVGNTRLGERHSGCFVDETSVALEPNANVFAPVFVPYLRWWSGTARCLVGSARDKALRRDGYDTQELLGAWGISSSMADSALAPIMSRAGVRKLSSTLLPVYCRALWLTCIAMGVSLRVSSDCGSAGFPWSVRNSIADVALRSLLPGTLWRFLDQGTLAIHAESCTEYVEQAIAAGYQLAEDLSLSAASNTMIANILTLEGLRFRPSSTHRGG